MNELSGVNFCMKQYRGYVIPECKTVYVTVIKPFRHSFKISVPYGADTDVYIVNYIKSRLKLRRCVQVGSMEYNYHIG